MKTIFLVGIFFPSALCIYFHISFGLQDFCFKKSTDNPKGVTLCVISHLSLGTSKILSSSLTLDNLN